MRLLTFCLVAFLSVANSYKILVYNSKYGHSHSNFLGMIADTLADAGHNVTSLIPIMDKTVKDGTDKSHKIYVQADPVIEQWYEDQKSGMPMNMFELRPMNPLMPFFMGPMLSKLFYLGCKKVIAEPGLLERLKAEKYDVYISENFDVCGMGLSAAIQPKSVIGTTASSLFAQQFAEFGVEPATSYRPVAFTSKLNVHSTFSRLLNLYASAPLEMSGKKKREYKEVNIFILAEEVVGEDDVKDCEGKLVEKFKELFRGRPIKALSAASAESASEKGKDAFQKRRSEMIFKFAICELQNYNMWSMAEKIDRQHTEISDLAAAVAKLLPKATTTVMDLAYLGKKIITIEMPGMPTIIMDLTRLAESFVVPPTMTDVDKRWITLGKHIFIKGFPASFLCVFSGSDSPKAYESLPESFMQALIECILLTCRSRGDNMSINRFQISARLRKSLNNFFEFRRREFPDRTKAEHIQRAMIDGFVPANYTLEEACEEFEVNKDDIKPHVINYPPPSLLDGGAVVLDNKEKSVDAEKKPSVSGVKIESKKRKGIASSYDPKEKKLRIKKEKEEKEMRLKEEREEKELAIKKEKEADKEPENAESEKAELKIKPEKDSQNANNIPGTSRTLMNLDSREVVEVEEIEEDYDDGW